MKHKLCDINRAVREKLPRFTDDKSGIGVHYVDAFLKPMNAESRRWNAGEMPSAAA